jgi:hypothetical protein
MQALLLNGALAHQPHIDRISDHIAHALQQFGWQTIGYTLRDEHINRCLGCFDCWVKTPGVCIVPHTNQDINALTMQSDLLVLVSHVTFGGYSSALKKMMDHQIPLIMPFFKRINGEVHHQSRYERYPSLLGIGVQQQPDALQADLFRRLVRANAVNLHAPFTFADVWTHTMSANDIINQTKRLIAPLQNCLQPAQTPALNPMEVSS